jgi:hypothetical protein
MSPLLRFPALLSLFLLSCGQEEPTKNAEQSPATPNKRETRENGNSGADAGVEKPDAGVDPYRDHIVLTEETPVNEIVMLVKQLQVRMQQIELREREVIQREQMVANLEEVTMQQVEVLWKLKAQVSELLEKVGEDFKDERKAYEIKLKKEKKDHLEKERKAAELRQKRAEELKQMAEEMTEARERRIVQLAATIKGMRASAGAGMLASMEDKDAVAVLRQLGARQAAALLGNMPADKAAHLAESMLGPKPISPEMVEEVSEKGAEASSDKKR